MFFLHETFRNYLDKKYSQPWEESVAKALKALKAQLRKNTLALDWRYSARKLPITRYCIWNNFWKVFSEKQFRINLWN